jgi:hypothetical protein
VYFYVFLWQTILNAGEFVTGSKKKVSRRNEVKDRKIIATKPVPQCGKVRKPYVLWLLKVSFITCKAEDARSALECGGWPPLSLCVRQDRTKSGGSPPHSKACCRMQKEKLLVFL